MCSAYKGTLNLYDKHIANQLAEIENKKAKLETLVSEDETLNQLLTFHQNKININQIYDEIK